MNIMIALVGGQPLPNLLPVRHYHPDAVLLVYTETTRGVFERLRATLRQETTVYELETDPYNIIDITERLHSCLDETDLADNQPIFNLTGGTKAMALAAYRVAQDRSASLLYLESERKQSCAYRYIWSDQQLQRLPNDVLPACITLKDFLDVHLGPGNWCEYGAGRQEGSSFETALATSLRALCADEVMIGVKTMNGQIDLDVVVRLGNQFGIIEAKAGSNGSKLDGIKQLSNAGRHLGTYTQQFYAITVERNDAHKAVVDASRIQIISLPGYVPTTEILGPDESSRLIEVIEKAMKV